MKILNYGFLMLAIIAISLTACEDDPDPILAPVLSSIIAEGTSFADGNTVSKDLNGAASASDIALNSSITITLDKAVDAGTVNASTVSLSDGSGDVEAVLNTSGATISIDPNSEFERGTQYTLNLGAIKSSDGGTLASVSRTFISEGRAPVIVPREADQLAYYNFDGQMTDQVGSYDPDNSVAIKFGSDRFGQGGSTATFDGDVSIIEIPDAAEFMDHGSISISFWLKTNSTDHLNQNGDPANFFVFGLAAFAGFQFEIPNNFSSCKLAMSYELQDGSASAEDLWFPGNGSDASNGGFQGWDFVADLTGSGGVEAILKDQWTHVVCTYNESERQGAMYFNGQLMKSQDFDLFPDTNPKYQANGVKLNETETDLEPILALGFIKSIDSPKWADTPWGDYNKTTSNHFKGDLDDFRIFKVGLTAEEVTALYDAEK